MKAPRTIWTLAAALILTAAVCRAGMDHEHMSHAGSPALERMKKLAGTWEGPDPMSKTGGKMMVEYTVTGAGSAVLERFAVGTPGEMSTLYYDQDGKLTMTHYCALGNRPVMALKSSSDKMLAMDLVPGSVSDKEAHMHSLAMEFPDADHLKASWTAYEDGKVQPPHAFEFARKR